MKRSIPLILSLLAIILLSTYLVKAACSAEPPRSPVYFSYIQECDDKLSLRLNLNSNDLTPEIIASLQLTLESASLPIIFDANGVINNCEVKVEGKEKTISGREVERLVAYCSGIRLHDTANSYERREDLSHRLPRIAHSLRRFEQFLMEEYALGNLNIQNSIALDNQGSILGGKIAFPADEDKHWIGGLVDNLYLAPETLQVKGVTITFNQDRITSNIVFNDLLSYFVEESHSGLEKYDVEIYTVAIYNNERNTLTLREGKFKINDKEVKNVRIGFIGSNTYFCSLDVEEPNAKDCMELRENKYYYVSAANPLQGIFNIGSITFAEEKIKSDNVEYIYPKTLQEAEVSIRIPA